MNCILRFWEGGWGLNIKLICVNLTLFQLLPCNYSTVVFRGCTIFPGGVAVRGLTATVPAGLDNVMCPSNATSALNCSFNIPPVSPQCYGNFSAAGVRCIQGIYAYLFVQFKE